MNTWTRERTAKLRSIVRRHTTHHDRCDCLIAEAADAIEELAEQVHYAYSSDDNAPYPHESQRSKIICRLEDIL